MDILIRFTSELARNRSDEYVWPTADRLILPKVGDSVDVLDLGFRNVTRISYTYDRRDPASNRRVTHLNIDVSCD